MLNFFGNYTDPSNQILNKSINNLEKCGIDGSINITLSIKEEASVPQEYQEVLKRLNDSLNIKDRPRALIERDIDDFCKMIDQAGDLFPDDFDLEITFQDKQGVHRQANISYTNSLTSDDVITQQNYDFLDIGEVAVSKLNSQLEKIGYKDGPLVEFRYGEECCGHRLFLASKDLQIIESAFPGLNPEGLLSKYPEGIPYSEVDPHFDKINDFLRENKYSDDSIAKSWMKRGDKDNQNSILFNNIGGVSYNCYNAALNIGSEQYDRINFVEQHEAPVLLEKHYKPLSENERPIPGRTLIVFDKFKDGRPEHYATYLFSFTHEQKEYHVVAQKKGGSIFNIELFDGKVERPQIDYSREGYRYKTYDVDDFYGPSVGWYNPK